VAGWKKACEVCKVAWGGGETPALAGIVEAGRIDLAASCTGLINPKSRLSVGDRLAAGDAIVLLASSGIHANGFSLIRQVMRDHSLFLTDPAPFASDQTLASALLVATRIYVQSLLGLFEHDVVKALAHVTGGGLTGNVPRALPAGLVARIDAASWQAPPMFRWLYEAARMTGEELLGTFNCGIGMVLVVVAEHADDVVGFLAEKGETVYRLGELIEGDGPARLQVHGMDG
jgi:phosphoribosylformylglycinamidine cyclo-ligase